MVIEALRYFAKGWNQFVTSRVTFQEATTIVPLLILVFAVIDRC